MLRLILFLQTNTIFITCQFNINIYNQKQFTRAIIGVNKLNTKIFNVIDVVVIDIHQQTQTTNDFCQIREGKQRLKKIITQHFFSLCSLVYINNHNKYGIENFIVQFINICYCSCKLFWVKICRIIIVHCDKYDVVCKILFVCCL